MRPVIAITGGIGCGKSVVSRVLRIRGFEVVDSDSHARSIMDTSKTIKERLRLEIHPASVDADGIIDRKLLADIVFADEEMLRRLNSIVHGEVLESLREIAQSADSSVLFVESAILYSSGLDRIAAAEWNVECPDDIRIRRVMARNGLTRSQVVDRIESQKTERPQGRLPLVRIVNDGLTPLLPQIDEALARGGFA